MLNMTLISDKTVVISPEFLFLSDIIGNWYYCHLTSRESMSDITVTANEKSNNGYTLVLIAAVCYGIQPFFAHFIYADGANTLGVLIARFSIAIILMLALLKIRGIKLPRGRLLVQSLLIGVGYAGAGLGYYSASQSASVSLAIILMFSFPAFVTLYSIIWLKEKATKTKIGSMLLALCGVFLATDGQLQGDVSGIAWALFAALSYGSAIIYGSHHTQPQDPLASAGAILLGGLLTFIMVGLVPTVTLPQSINGWAAMVGLAFICTILPIVTFISGSPKIGAADASTLSSLEPIVAVLVAVSLIGESVSLRMAAGGVLVISAAYLLSRQQSSLITKTKANR